MDRFTKVTQDLRNVATLAEFGRAIDPLLNFDDPREYRVYAVLLSGQLANDTLGEDNCEAIRQVIQTWREQPPLVKFTTLLVLQRLLNRQVDKIHDLISGPNPCLVDEYAYR